MKDTCYPITGSWPGRLVILARPRGGDWLEGEVNNWASLGLNVVVSLLTTDEVEEFGLMDEEKSCRSKGIQFLTLPILDRGVPRSREEMLRLVRKIDGEMADGKMVGIHCRQGIGRSGLLAACLLVSTGLSLETAFERLTQARGCSVPETSEQRQWVEEMSKGYVSHG